MSGRAALQEATPAHNHAASGSRAARAAARVAARYAKAPSYSEMLTWEARAAVDAAKAAAQAAEQAQAAFQYVLDGLEAAPAAEPAWKLEPPPVSARNAAPATVSQPRQKPQDVLRTHREPRLQTAAVQEAAIARSREFEAGGERDELIPYDPAPHYDTLAITEVEAGPGEMVRPIYANLIEFPRPMVATRRARPRLAEGPLAASGSAPQLSIFEVDPAAISIAPSPATVDPSAPPSWMCTELPALAPEALPPSVDLEAVPLSTNLTVFDAQPWEEPAMVAYRDEPATQPESAPTIELAPLSRRLLAVVVDCALTGALLVLAVLLGAPHMGRLPAVRTVEIGAVLALVALGLAYQACFLTLARATPGMWYARIEIDSFSGLRATRSQRCRRLLALLLSVLPVGLGVLWALFDEAGLAWHDRLSKTYLHKR